jgi:hypothetical protein
MLRVLVIIKYFYGLFLSASRVGRITLSFDFIGKLLPMGNQELKNQFFKVLTLLIGLYIFNQLLIFLAPLLVVQSAFMFASKGIMMVARYSHWIGNLLFAIIITFMLRKRADVFIYVGLLAIVQPVFGGLFN